jgi:hypothetical protein
MQDRPTSDQLLEAVAAFLRDQVVPATQGPIQFHVRVAANALDIARREAMLAPAAQAREQAALAALLNADPHTDLAELNRLLCARIVDGTVSLDTPGLARTLWRITLDKLAVDQPSYDTHVRALRAAPDEDR